MFGPHSAGPDLLLKGLTARDKQQGRVVVGDAPHKRKDAGTTNSQLFDQLQSVSGRKEKQNRFGNGEALKHC